MLTEREREVVECMLRGWLRAEMPLYGGLAYIDVMNLMDKFGVDKSELVEQVQWWQDLADRTRRERDGKVGELESA